jgi:hypothetical protein
VALALLALVFRDDNEPGVLTEIDCFERVADRPLTAIMPGLARCFGVRVYVGISEIEVEAIMSEAGFREERVGTDLSGGLATLDRTRIAVDEVVVSGYPAVSPRIGG